jgi:DNA polymerase-3 subunit epsilon
MGFIIIVCCLIVLLLWKMTMPYTSFVSWIAADTTAPSKNSKIQQRSSASADDAYSGPETWQCKGLNQRLFLYASDHGQVAANDFPFAVLDFETTGLEPYHKHRIVEVGVALFSADGTHESSFTSLINPEIPIDNVPYHGITDDDVQEAPTAADTLPYLLHLLSDRVIVSHNAPFEEVFLFHAAQRAGLSLNYFCAVDTLSLARACLDLPNHKLGTICEYLGIDLDAPHEAEADAIATAKLYINLRKRRSLYIPQRPPTQNSGSDKRPKVIVRPPKLLKGTDGYMANLLRLLPTSSMLVENQSEDAYVDMLTAALSDSKLEKQEAQHLAKLALEMGLSAQRVKQLNTLFLEAALTAAMQDARLEAEELRNLKALAKNLGTPGYFDQLKAERRKSTKKP